jgi:hypothetical protein
MRTALTVLVEVAAIALHAHASIPQRNAKNDNSGRLVPLMVLNSTASHVELQALFPLLSVSCDGFIDIYSESRGKSAPLRTYGDFDPARIAIQRWPRPDTAVR